MISKVLYFFSSIPHDKLLHFIAGVIITLFLGWFIPVIAILGSIIAGITKEIYDEITYGGWDWNDIYATILGGLLIQIFIWL